LSGVLRRVCLKRNFRLCFCQVRSKVSVEFEWGKQCSVVNFWICVR
jgi:hypothetical protein